MNTFGAPRNMVNFHRILPFLFTLACVTPNALLGKSHVAGDDQPDANENERNPPIIRMVRINKAGDLTPDDDSTAKKLRACGYGVEVRDAKTKEEASTALKSIGNAPFELAWISAHGKNEIMNVLKDGKAVDIDNLVLDENGYRLKADDLLPLAFGTR